MQKKILQELRTKLKEAELLNNEKNKEFDNLKAQLGQQNLQQSQKEAEQLQAYNEEKSALETKLTEMESNQ